MKNTLKAASSERGAVLVHVALALIALMSFSTFVIDYGVLWTARRQAQNAADAAAMAGAVALAFDNPTDLSNSGAAKSSAYEVLMNHPIWGQQPVVEITTEITIPSCPDDGSTNCVRVDVYRDEAHGNALPMIFGQLVGLNQQRVRAMAMAKVSAANASDCLKPWGVADKWVERSPTPHDPVWDTDTFYPLPQGGIANPDLYIPQNGSASAGTGFSLAADFGTQVRLKLGTSTTPVTPGFFHPLDLCPGGCAAEYRDNIAGCVGQTWKVGDTIPTLSGAQDAPTTAGVNDLLQLDQSAVWDPSLNGGRGGVANSCAHTNTCVDAQNNPIQLRQSPRIVAIPVFDLQTYYDSGTVVVVNILGFFVDSIQGTDVIGRIMIMPNQLIMPNPSETGLKFVAGPASFIRAISLIR